MDTQTDAGKCSTLGKLLLDAHVSGREFAEALLLDTTHASTGGLAVFFEALASSDRALANTVLRSWGIRQ